MRRWRSPISSLTILAMLFWLGTAMAPSVTPDGLSASSDNKTISAAKAEQNGSAPDDRDDGGQGLLLPWPDYHCGVGCPEPPLEPTLDSNEWRPEVEFVATTAVPAGDAPVSEPKAPVPGPPSSPRPVEEWRSLVSAYFAPEHVDLALRIIGCESGGDPNAQNPNSGAAGLFQHIPRYWEARVAGAGMPGASIFDPIANVAASAYLAYSDGWTHWSASAGCWQ